MTEPLAREHPRDTAPTMFTEALRTLVASDPAVLAAVFLDRDGECVDYCSALPPFEAKVLGAQLLVLVENLRPTLAKLRHGEFAELHVHAERYELVARRVDEDYGCVVVRAERGDDAPMLSALDDAIDELRRIAGLDVPRWDAVDLTLVVETRTSVGWSHAPAVVLERGQRTVVDAVFGRWEEPSGLAGRPLECFRCHMADGRDETLVFDPGYGRWYRW